MFHSLGVEPLPYADRVAREEEMTVIQERRAVNTLQAISKGRFERARVGNMVGSISCSGSQTLSRALKAKRLKDRLVCVINEPATQNRLKRAVETRHGSNPRTSSWSRLWAVMGEDAAGPTTRPQGHLEAGQTMQRARNRYEAEWMRWRAGEGAGEDEGKVSVHEHAALMGRRGYDNKRGHMDINDRDRVGSIGSDLMDHSGNDRLDSRDSGYESGGGGRYVDDRSRGHRIGSVTEGTESVRMPDSMPGAAGAEGIQEAMQWFVRAQGVCAANARGLAQRHRAAVQDSPGAASSHP